MTKVSSNLPKVVRRYYRLTKPGIIRGNVMTAAAGFLFASRTNVQLMTLLYLLVGTALVIASGCVLNNYLDRNIDAKMTRTAKRSLVTGEISGRSAILYASILGVLGFSLLIMKTNPLTAAIGGVGFLFYVVFYSVSKRRSPNGTLVGSVSGATALVAGYTAVTGSLDLTAVLLFSAMVFWQMPHFYSIALFRLSEYKAAQVPVLPLVRGDRYTKKQIFFYTILFVLSVLAIGVNAKSVLIVIVMLGICSWWLYLAWKGFGIRNTERWARKEFGVSLVVLLVFSVTLALYPFIPIKLPV